MSDSDVPQRSGRTTRHRIRTDRTDPDLQESVAQCQEHAGNGGTVLTMDAAVLIDM